MTRLFIVGGADETYAWRKDPDEAIDLAFDWSRILAGDTVVSSHWSFPVGVTQSQPATIDGYVTTVWIGPGAEGGELVNTVTTSRGRTLERVLQLAVSEQTGGGSAISRPFKWFHATPMAEMTDLLGMTAMPILGESSFTFTNGTTGPATQASVEALAAAHQGDPYVFVDIERWPIGQPHEGYSSATNVTSLANHADLLRWWKAVNPTTKLGLWAFPRPPDPRSAYYDLQASEYPALCSQVRDAFGTHKPDFAIGVGYWGYDLPEGNIAANAMWLAEARAWGIPEAFMCCTHRGYGSYFGGTKQDNGSEVGTYINVTTLRYLLDWCQRNVDGIIWWAIDSETGPNTETGGRMIIESPWNAGAPPPSAPALIRAAAATNYQNRQRREEQWIVELHRRIRGSA